MLKRLGPGLMLCAALGSAVWAQVSAKLTASTWENLPSRKHFAC
jgi:hypothetical protein